MKSLYKYPQTEFPYKQLIKHNQNRRKNQPEYEINDTGVFDESKYWDIDVEFVKVKPRHILCRYTVHNRGLDTESIHVLPTIWFRNTWNFEKSSKSFVEKPTLEKISDHEVKASHAKLGSYTWKVDAYDSSNPALIFTENESRHEDNFLSKDAFHDFLIKGDETAVLSDQGTKCAAHYKLTLDPGSKAVINYQLFHEDETEEIPFAEFQRIFTQKEANAAQFYNQNLPSEMPYQMKNVCIQAYAGLLWNKMFYHYPVKDWMNHSETRNEKVQKTFGVNSRWTHLECCDVLSVPDKWEFPWFAVWDLAFHMIPMAEIDIDFAKNQLLLFLSHRYLSMDGKLPAYDMNLSDQNPPVHAWACWNIYQRTIDRGEPDDEFLEKAFLGLLPNYTNWVGQSIDNSGLYAGGFLGFDNISAVNRSSPGVHRIYQADGTGWVAFFSIHMLKIALILCKKNHNYEEYAIKFLKHFFSIKNAINESSDISVGLWNEDDRFYYDKIQRQYGDNIETLRVRSLVGIVPLFAQCILYKTDIEEFPWLKEILSDNFSSCEEESLLLSLVNEDKLRNILRYLLDETEFLSPYGIRSLSKFHDDNSYILKGAESLSQWFNLLWWLLGLTPPHSQTGRSVKYAAGNARSDDCYGGNSNWRGPIWICINYLIIETLETLYLYYGDTMKLECPVGSNVFMNLDEVSQELIKRVTSIFLLDQSGFRPCHGTDSLYETDPTWSSLLLFHEFFNAETGEGLGASHQTGWTALITTLIRKLVQHWTSDPGKPADEINK
ncbi:uncharacterized protein LOC141901439 [Tubulanus polymorphus]|uniref:uncharacterized protein LOC141901439 n=1 Tax=Tubulanus polymorphus TaxID=672921 RepID=UPI003DA6A559